MRTRDKLLSLAKEYCFRIQNGRHLNSILQHARGEMDELHDEIHRANVGLPQYGEDGVVGEAVDVMLCMIDIIYTYDPHITEDQILSVVEEKLDKWERVYGDKKEGNE